MRFLAFLFSWDLQVAQCSTHSLFSFHASLPLCYTIMLFAIVILTLHLLFPPLDATAWVEIFLALVRDIMLRIKAVLQVR